MDFETIKKIFGEAAALDSPAGRAAYLDAACAGDPAARRQIESWLVAHSELGDWLEPAVKPFPNDDPAIIGTRVGPYQILQKIGEGGFGVVYMAEQEQPLRRKVALKIIKAGMDTKQVIARFEAERQALAMMDHPNIAHVLDAGETDRGRPFFVMELVKGIPITEFCDRKKLSLRDRLELFIKVCHAVQHAHQKGIIHRDLKPSNVMITIVDGQPVPKVIDFGVAKAIEQKLTDQTLFTRYDQLIGTPAYMSPEQAELSGSDADTRSDVYSLGVLLYELLTGTPPIESDTLRHAGLDEIRKLIRETDPPKPSTRLQTLREKLTTVAETRQLEPAALCKTVRGDLDWIVMKCLEKDRARRYATSTDIAADLERYLSHEPVAARPPGVAYLFGRFVRRHRLQVAFAAALVVSLLAGLIFALVGFDRARTEAARSEQVARFLEDMLKGVDPAAAQGRDTTVLREILDRAAQRLAKELAAQPAVEAELRTTLGHIYSDLGEYTNAAAMHERALALRLRLYGPEHPEAAASQYHLGNVCFQLHRDAQAESLLRAAAAAQKKIEGPGSLNYARSLRKLSNILVEQGGDSAVESTRLLREAEPAFRRALALPEYSVGNAEKRAGVMDEFGSLLLRLPESNAEAEEFNREMLAFVKTSLGEKHPYYNVTLRRLCLVLMSSGKLASAEAVAREARETHARTYGGEHPATVSSLTLLGAVLQRRGEFVEAESLLRQAVELRQKTPVVNQRSLAHELFLHGAVLAELGRLPEARTNLQTALLIRASLTPAAWEGFETQGALGGVYFQEKNYAAAEPLLLSAAEGFQSCQPPVLSPGGRMSPSNVVTQLVQLYEATGQPETAGKWRQKLTELQRKLGGR